MAGICVSAVVYYPSFFLSLAKLAEEEQCARADKSTQQLVRQSSCTATLVATIKDGICTVFYAVVATIRHKATLACLSVHRPVTDKRFASRLLHVRFLHAEYSPTLTELKQLDSIFFFTVS